MSKSKKIKPMTVKQLMEKLESMLLQGQIQATDEIEIEGCDCYGALGAVESGRTYGEEDPPHVLLRRADCL